MFGKLLDRRGEERIATSYIVEWVSFGSGKQHLSRKKERKRALKMTDGMVL